MVRLCTCQDLHKGWLDMQHTTTCGMQRLIAIPQWCCLSKAWPDVQHALTCAIQMAVAPSCCCLLWACLGMQSASRSIH